MFSIDLLDNKGEGASCLRYEAKNTLAISKANEILAAFMGVKGVRVLAYERCDAEVALLIERIVTDPTCPDCGARAQIHGRPVIDYIDLSVFGTPMVLR